MGHALNQKENQIVQLREQFEKTKIELLGKDKERDELQAKLKKNEEKLVKKEKNIQ